MIRLEVESYCHECPYFEAEVKNPQVLYADFEIYEIVGDTIVTCRYKYRCELLKKNLMKRMFDHDIPDQTNN